MDSDEKEPEESSLTLISQTPEFAMTSYKPALQEKQRELVVKQKEILALRAELEAQKLLATHLAETLHKIVGGATIKIVQSNEKP